MTHFSRQLTRSTTRLTRSLAIGAAIALFAGACAVAAPPSAQLNAPQTTPGTRNAYLWPFAANSWVNTPVATTATYGSAAPFSYANINAESLVRQHRHRR